MLFFPFQGRGERTHGGETTPASEGHPRSKSLSFQIIDGKNSRALREYLSKEDQVLLPFLECIERTELALDEVIDVAGRATIEAIVDLSAKQVAGEKHPGKKGSEIRWPARQGDVVNLSERQVRVSRPVFV